MLVEQAQELRLVECPLDAPLGDGLDEVDQGSRDRGHRDAVDHRHVGARKLRSVDADAASWLAAGASRNRDVDPRRSSLPQSPEVRGRPVAERGALAAGEHGGHSPSRSVEPRVADRVNPAVDDVEAPGGHAVVDRAGPEAEVPQLGAGDHAMLDVREVRDLPVDGGLRAFTSYIGVKAPNPPDPPRGRASRRPSTDDYTF